MNIRGVELLSFLILFVGVPFRADAISHTKNDTIKKAWGLDGAKLLQKNEHNFTGPVYDMWLQGGIGRNNDNSGSNGDEHGGVALFATQIAEHGALFCPYQVQCDNKHGKCYSNTRYVTPNGMDPARHCQWLCADGYSGTGCLTGPGTLRSLCDESDYRTKFSGVSMRKDGGYNDSVEMQIMGWTTIYHHKNSNGHRSAQERDFLPAVVKFLDHGVLAANVRIDCYAEHKQSNSSWIDGVGSYGTPRLLCANGYRPNAYGNDCEPVDMDFCKIATMTMCEGFPLSGFDGTIHRIDTERADCVRYFCADDSKAFPATGGTSCEPCGANNGQAGPHPDTGKCTVCPEVGQYFDRQTGSCGYAVAYTKTDIQYGKGKTVNSRDPVSQQCWTLVSVLDIQNCVKGKPFGQDAESETSTTVSRGNL